MMNREPRLKISDDTVLLIVPDAGMEMDVTGKAVDKVIREFNRVQQSVCDRLSIPFSAGRVVAAARGMVTIKPKEAPHRASGPVIAWPSTEPVLAEVLAALPVGPGVGTTSSAWR